MRALLTVLLVLFFIVMMSGGTHKVFAETSRTWAQFGSKNIKAIAAITAAVIVGGGMYRNKLQTEANQLEAVQLKSDPMITSPPPPHTRRRTHHAPQRGRRGASTAIVSIKDQLPLMRPIARDPWGWRSPSDYTDMYILPEGGRQNPWLSLMDGLSTRKSGLTIDSAQQLLPPKSTEEQITEQLKQQRNGAHAALNQRQSDNWKSAPQLTEALAMMQVGQSSTPPPMGQVWNLFDPPLLHAAAPSPRLYPPPPPASTPPPPAPPPLPAVYTLPQGEKRARPEIQWQPNYDLVGHSSDDMNYGSWVSVQGQDRGASQRSRLI